MSSSSPWPERNAGDTPSAEPAFPLFRRAEAAEPAPEQEESEAERARKPEVGTIEVIVRLSDGDGVLLGRFADEDEAKACAEELVQSVADSDGRWPFVSGRFLRPGAIVSIDINTSGPKWTGSTGRAVSWSGRQQQEEQQPEQPPKPL